MTEQQMSKKRYLALDTSTHMLTVAVVEGTKVLKEISSSAERNHSLYLTPTIKEVLDALAMQVQDVDGIIVGRGPGSYTGVRIGVTVGKTLAWVSNKPVVGVSSLEGLALAGWQQGTEMLQDSKGEAMLALGEWVEGQPVHWVIPLMDARRGQVYTSLWRGQINDEQIGWQEVVEDRVRLMKDWVDQLVNRSVTEGVPDCIWVVGDVELHRAEAERLQVSLSCPVNIVPNSMEARWLGLTGGKRLLQGESDDTHRLEPNYTQLAEAEANLLKKQ